MQGEGGKNRGLVSSHGSEGVATVGTVPARTGSWRERQRWRVARCGGGADPLIPSGGAHPLFLPGDEEKPAREEGQYGRAPAREGEGQGDWGGY